MNKNFVKSKLKKNIANTQYYVPSIKYFAFHPIGFVFKPEENVADDNNDVNTDNTVSPNIYIFL